MTTLTAYRRPSLLGRGVFDDIFDSMLDFPTLMNRTTQGYPVADIYQDEGQTVLEFALAGFSKEDLSVEIKQAKVYITPDLIGDNQPDMEDEIVLTYAGSTRTAQIVNIDTKQGGQTYLFTLLVRF